MICEQHFEETDYRTDKKFYLNKTAVPKRHPSVLREDELQVTEPQRTYLERKRPLTPTDDQDERKRKNLCYLRDQTATDSMDEMSGDSSRVTENRLSSKISFLAKKYRSYRFRISKMKQKMTQTKMSTLNVIYLSTIISKAAKALVTMQARGKRKQWYKNEKQFAISLYYKSPSTYMFLRRQGIVLPSPTTIKRWSNESAFKTGIDDVIAKQLAMKCAVMTKIERKCTVCFDEMPVQDCLQYSRKLDFFEGFEDLGPLGRTSKHATQALVFFIRGLFSNWTLPLAYYFSNDCIKPETLKSIVLNVLSTTKEIGFDPKVIICNQKSNTREALDLLDVSIEKPYIAFQESKIFSICDVPQLFESIRTNWLSGDFRFLEKTISFQVVKDADKIPKDLDIATTLTDITKPSKSFINDSWFSQVLSNSVPSAIQDCVLKGDINEEIGNNTAWFVNELKNLFDAFNSKSLHSHNIYDCALNLKDPLVIDTLKSNRDIFQSLVKITEEETHHRPLCFDGMVQSITAILDWFNEEQCDFILTSKLNQSVIDKFFTSVKKSNANLNPTCRDFRNFFKSSLVHNLLKPPKLEISRKNFDITREDENIVNIHNVINEDPSSIPNQSVAGSSKLLLEDCIISYYAGYVVKSVIDKFDCKICQDSLTYPGLLDDPQQLILLNKNYNCKDTYVYFPSEMAVNLVNKCLILFKTYFGNITYQESVSLQLNEKVMSRNFLWLGAVNDVCYEHKTYLITKIVDDYLLKFYKSSKT